MPQGSPYAYSFVSCSMKDAADRTGVSIGTLSKAISQGDLVAHYAGDKNTRIPLRAAALDAWVQALPTWRRHARWA